MLFFYLHVDSTDHKLIIQIYIAFNNKQKKSIHYYLMMFQ